MNPQSQRWKAVTPSEFPMEREALEYVREGLPDHEPYRAWSNFEFVAEDGSINEVDLLVLAPGGFYLIEIKSHQGAISGDAGTWTVKFDGREKVMDNPLLLTNRKAKRLKSLLQRQSAAKKVPVPFLEAIVFLSATNLQVQLEQTGRRGVWIRDDKVDTADLDSPPGILSEIRKVGGGHRSSVTSKVARYLSRAMDEAGIRRSQKARRLGDYVLDALYFDGETYQDWTAHHTSLEGLRRRVRIYISNKTGASRDTISRAARRELQILEGIDHPGILRPREFKEHELGPALLFDHFPKSKRLDHFLKSQAAALSFDDRLHLFRQLAEILQVAHEKRLYHRALSPQSILVENPEDPSPSLRIFNWQTGVRESSSTTPGRTVSGTVHPDQLVESAATAYLAPEVRQEVSFDPASADVFSLGAIGYHLFSGHPPATSAFELHKKLHREGGTGLHLSEATDGVPDSLEELISMCTAPRPLDRFASVEDTLDWLTLVEEELTRPDAGAVEDPNLATAGDLLEGGFRVQKRIGQGSTSFAYFVEREGKDEVLKLARDESHNGTLRAEAEVLSRLHHQNIVQLYEQIEIYGRVGLLLAPIGLDRKRSDEDRAPRTLAESLHKEGPPSIDLLERFGEHLLLAVKHLEEQGIAHRDIKPDNLGIQPMGPNDALHLVLFDFSLSRAPLENLHVGTRPYLDPFLETRQQKQWDLAAERYAAAVTLHEMATGLLPVWGDGKTAPQFTEGEAKIASDRLPTLLRKPLADFFARALRRDASERFDNAEEMYRAWMRAFESAEEPALPVSPETEEEEKPDYLELATLESQVIELGLTTRALNALERLGIDTARDLLTTPLRRITHQKGVGNKTRKEVVRTVRALRARFPDVTGEAAPPAIEPGPDATDETSTPPSIDRLVQALLPARAQESTDTGSRTIRLYLGLEAAPGIAPWCTQSDIARHLDVTRARVGQIVGGHRERWRRVPTLTGLREEIAEILALEGGVMTGPELERAVLAARGSSHDGGLRHRFARAVTRAALEVERTLDNPRWIERRTGDVLLVARETAAEGGPSAQSLADHAKNLGAAADELAAQDPLPSPSAVIQVLQKITPPEGAPPLPNARLVQLAAAASQNAAASPRLELYPRGLDPARAVALSAATFLGSKDLTPQSIRARVLSRFPEAVPPPDRPELDDLLSSVGIDLAWDPSRGPSGAYTLPGHSTDLTNTGSFTPLTETPSPGTVSQESKAREFERRLARLHEEGRFLILMVPDPRYLQSAETVLSARLGVAPVSLDRLLIGTMHEVAVEKGIDWNRVLHADAAPTDSQDWKRLQQLLDLTLPRVEKKLLALRGTVLLTHPGLLARYDRLGFLERFRDAVGPDREAPHGLWVLVPGDDQSAQPTLDGKVIPAVTRAEYTRLPPSWPSKLNGTTNPSASEIHA